jgi:signal transduction histidine kinase
VPARIGGRRTAGVSVHGSLASLYEGLRANQKVVLLYILLDTLILALAGMALLSRVVVRPIRKLLSMTEAYRGGDFLVPLEATSGSEIRQLSRSLSHMVERLDENRESLKEHIASLEQANEELRKAQDEIIRSEKLASVGRLAAGIAHEIGNPIGVILGYLELARRSDISEAERKDFLQRAEVEVSRINRTIRSLLDFSRASENRPERVSVHALIRDTLEMLAPQKIMQDVRLDLSLNAAPDEVFSDPGRLRQVFLNVLMNAADALHEDGPGGGTPGAIRIETSAEVGWIEVRISDNGPGISPGDLHQVFDPFYTTKDPGKGTGLGLSVSHRIVEDLKGTIRVTSAEGRGTEVSIRLPLRRGGEGEP